MYWKTTFYILANLHTPWEDPPTPPSTQSRVGLRDPWTIESTLGVFIDIEGAFDKTTFPKITAALTEKYVPVMVGSWISNMISKRAVQISVGDASVRGRVARGCPQVAVISPVLWNLVLDSLLCRLNSEGFDTMGLFHVNEKL